ncbi:hypothetical protein RB595_003759 [Gaeumannomyces hyphopodioides]
MASTSPPSARGEFQIAIVCALPLEADAVDLLFDELYASHRYGRAIGDYNSYSTGRIAGHAVVRLLLPGIGPQNAASASASLRSSYPNINLALLVGVCGGLPIIDGRNAYLGDVVISKSIFNCDFGRQYPDQFYPKESIEDSLGRANIHIRGLLATFSTRLGMRRIQSTAKDCIHKLQVDAPADYTPPPDTDDKLFPSHWQHRHRNQGCKACESELFCEQAAELSCNAIGCDGDSVCSPRTSRTTERHTDFVPQLFIGKMASSNAVIKSGAHRDRIAQDHEVIAFEMEGAGAWDQIPCIVVKGICDYADSHKRKEWQKFAAATAASVAAAILCGYMLPDTIAAADTTASASSKHRRQSADQPGSSSPKRRRTSALNEASASNSIDATLGALLVDKLFFSKIDERLTSLTQAQGKTCRWFLAKPEYKAWRDLARQPDDSGFLWIKGNPGTGKSTLMKLLFEEARKEAKGDHSRITLSFFFLARGEIEEKSTVGLYRSLLHQLLEKDVDLRDSLEWMTAYGAKGILQNGWHEKALNQTLMNAVSKLGSRSLAIFVDALDECDQTQVAGMVCFFEELCDHATESGVNLRICFSSRHYPAVVIKKGVEATLEAEEGHTNDIEQYIKSKLRLGKSSQAEALRSEIREKSSGIFLWVVLVLDILNREYPNSTVSIANIRKRLREIPDGLQNLFEMILARDSHNLDELHLCLKWILFANRPLRPPELYFAVHVGLNKDSAGRWDREDVGEEQMKIFVRSSSKGLAEVTRNKASEVQFIHESVRDFLLGRYGEQWSEASGNFEGHSHSVLKDCCLAQLNAPIRQTVDIPDAPPQDAGAAKSIREALQYNFPFLEYAVLNALHHANSAQQHGVEQEKLPEDFSLSQWAILNNALERHAIRRYTKTVDLVYILAEKNLAHLIRIHHQPTAFFAVGEERYGPPIFAALATESYEAVEAILQGIQKTSQSLPPPFHHDLEALYRQNKGRYHKFSRQMVFSQQQGVRRHLEINMDNNADDAIFLAYLLSGQVSAEMTFWAAEKGHQAGMQLLLDTGKAEVGSKDKYGRTPLSWAAEGGHEGIVKLLLATGKVDVDSKDNNRQTSLSWAVENGHEGIVKLLLATGKVNVDSKDNNGRTPLSWAAKGGHESIVKLLLAAGKVDVDSKDNNRRTPLSWAANGGHESIVKLLLAAGKVDVNSKDEHWGQTPLSWAAEGGHEGIVKLLLAAGKVDVDSKDNNGQTPLSWAAENGHEGIAKLLLATGKVNVDSKDNNGRTPLSWAAKGGHESIVKLLLAAGKVDVNSKDEHWGQTPLSWAAEGGHEGIVKLLLAAGKVDVDSKDNNGQTPLSWAAENGHEGIVKLLLATGKAEVGSKDKYGRTPLSRAAKGGHESIVKLLLAAGKVDVDSKDNNGRTPLSWAVRGRHEGIVKLLWKDGDGHVAKLLE